MVGFQLSGFSELSGRLNNAQQTVRTNVDTAIKKSAIQIQRYARQEAPVVTGRLRNSIDAQFMPSGARIGPRVKYALYVHQGTGEYALGPTSGRIKQGGIHPNQFMTRAEDKVREEVIGFFKEAQVGIVKDLK